MLQVKCVLTSYLVMSSGLQGCRTELTVQKIKRCFLDLFFSQQVSWWPVSFDLTYMVISAGNHPPKYMSPLANDLASSMILWHLFHIVYDMCLWTYCNNPFMFLNPRLPNTWLQNVISSSEVHTGCWACFLWYSLHLSPRRWWEGTCKMPW